MNFIIVNDEKFILMVNIILYFGDFGEVILVVDNKV